LSFFLLLVLVLGGLFVTASGGLGALPLDTTRTSTSEGRVHGVVEVLLRLQSDDEGWDVDHLLADTDVTLPDEDTSVVNRLGEARLEDLGLQPPLQEILNLEGQHVIQPHPGVVEHADADETTDKGVTLEEALGVLVVELEELTSRTTDLGEGQGDTPDLSLVAETVLSGELELGIETSGLVRTTGNLVGLGVGPWSARHLEERGDGFDAVSAVWLVSRGLRCFGVGGLGELTLS